MPLGLTKVSRPRLVGAYLMRWCLIPECGVRVAADWSGRTKEVIGMTRGWVSTVAHHIWMGAIALTAPECVRTMFVFIL